MFEISNFTRNFYKSPIVPEEGGSESSIKGRTIVSELSRINKAFGTISKKKTIIGQLSDITDAAEAGKIGGGSGALIVHEIIDDGDLRLDKTWQEIYDAMANNTSVFIKDDHAGVDNVSVRFDLVAAVWSGLDGDTDTERMAYNVLAHTLQLVEPLIAASKFTCDSPDGYPVWEDLEKNEEA